MYATENYTTDQAYQASLIAFESIDALAEQFYIELITSGIGDVIEACAYEDPRGIEAIAIDAGLISDFDDEIPFDNAIRIMGKEGKELLAHERNFFYAVDEMASRMATEKAERIARRAGY